MATKDLDYFQRNKQTITPFNMDSINSLGRGIAGTAESVRRSGVVPLLERSANAVSDYAQQKGNTFGRNVTNINNAVQNLGGKLLYGENYKPTMPLIQGASPNNGNLPSTPQAGNSTPNHPGLPNQNISQTPSPLQNSGGYLESDAGLPYRLAGANRQIQFANPNGTGFGTLDTGDANKNEALAIALNDGKGQANFIDTTQLYEPTGLPKQTQQAPVYNVGGGGANYAPQIEQALRALNNNQSTRFDSLGSLISKKGNRNQALGVLETLTGAQSQSDRTRAGLAGSALNANVQQQNAAQQAEQERMRNERDAYYNQQRLQQQDRLANQELAFKRNQANRPVITKLTGDNGDTIDVRDPRTGNPVRPSDEDSQFLAALKRAGGNEAAMLELIKARLGEQK
jgi:hypothetical protein